MTHSWRILLFCNMYTLLNSFRSILVIKIKMASPVLRLFCVVSIRHYEYCAYVDVSLNGATGVTERRHEEGSGVMTGLGGL